MLPDLVNGMFEVAAGFFIMNHCRVLMKDKEVKGVSTLSTVFFTIWGYWNLYYYPALEQWISTAGAVFIVAANTLWLFLMLHYIKYPGGRNPLTVDDEAELKKWVEEDTPSERPATERWAKDTSKLDALIDSIEERYGSVSD